MNKLIEQEITPQTLATIPEQAWDFKQLSSYPGLNLDWIRAYPKADWNFKKLSKHKKFRGEWFETRPDGDWDFHVLSRQDIYFEWLRLRPDAPWDYDYLSEHMSIYFTKLREFSDKWNYKILSRRLNLTLDWIEEFPNADWDFPNLHQAYHFNISWFYKFPNKPWNLQALCKYAPKIELMKFYPSGNWSLDDLYDTNLSYKFLNSTQHLNWDTDLLAASPFCKYSWLTLFSRFEWNFYILSRNPKCQLSWLQLHNEADWHFDEIATYCDNIDINWFFHLDKSYWDMDILSSHKNLTLEWITSYSEWKWNFNRIQETKNFKIEWLLEEPNLPWKYNQLTNHPKLTLEYIDRIGVSKFKEEHLSFNPHLTLEWIQKHSNLNWEVKYLAHNPNFQLSWLDAKHYNSERKIFTFTLPQLFRDGYIMSNSRIQNMITLDMITQYQDSNWTLFIMQIKKLNIDWLIASPQIEWEMYSPNLGFRKFLQKTPFHREHKDYDLFHRYLKQARKAKDYDKIANLFRLVKYKLPIMNIDMYQMENIYEPLQLQTLGGEIYMLEGWSEQKNLMRFIRSQLAEELGEFDILATLNDIRDCYAHHGKTQELKHIFLAQKQGPEAMIVFTD